MNVATYMGRHGDAAAHIAPRRLRLVFLEGREIMRNKYWRTLLSVALIAGLLVVQAAPASALDVIVSYEAKTLFSIGAGWTYVGANVYGTSPYFLFQNGAAIRAVDLNGQVLGTVTTLGSPRVVKAYDGRVVLEEWPSSNTVSYSIWNINSGTVQRLLAPSYNGWGWYTVYGITGSDDGLVIVYQNSYDCNNRARWIDYTGWNVYTGTKVYENRRVYGTFQSYSSCGDGSGGSMTARGWQALAVIRSQYSGSSQETKAWWIGPDGYVKYGPANGRSTTYFNTEFAISNEGLWVNDYYEPNGSRHDGTIYLNGRALYSYYDRRDNVLLHSSYWWAGATEGTGLYKQRGINAGQLYTGWFGSQTIVWENEDYIITLSINYYSSGRTLYIYKANHTAKRFDAVSSLTVPNSAYNFFVDESSQRVYVLDPSQTYVMELPTGLILAVGNPPAGIVTPNVAFPGRKPVYAGNGVVQEVQWLSAPDVARAVVDSAVTDVRNNLVNHESRIVALEQDDTAPIINIEWANRATITGAGSYTLRIAAEDNQSIKPQLQMRYRVRNGPWSNWLATTNGTWIVSVGLVSGWNPVEIEVKDAAGNVRTITTGIFRR